MKHKLVCEEDDPQCPYPILLCLFPCSCHCKPPKPSYPYPSQLVCVCVSMTELRLKRTTEYKEWYIGIVNLCMQGVCFVNLGTCMVCVTHGMQICERDKSSWRILYFLLSSNTWEVRDGSELALMQVFCMQILTCKCKLCQWGHATSGLVGLGSNWETKEIFFFFTYILI